MFYFNSNKPQRLFLQNISCIRKAQVISRRRGGGGDAHRLHPPPWSTPGSYRPMKSNLDYSMQDFSVVESEIVDSGIRNSVQGIRNPSNGWNPESRFYWQGIWNPVGRGEGGMVIKNPILFRVTLHRAKPRNIRKLQKANEGSRALHRQ